MTPSVSASEMLLHDQITLTLPTLQGWCSPEKAIAMADLILETKPRVVVEIGVFGGASLIPQAMALRHNTQTFGGADGRIYGIDPWQKDAALEGTNDPANDKYWAELDLEAIHRGCMQAIWGHHLDRWATIIRARSEHVYPLWAISPPNPQPAASAASIDILSLDGNHSQEASTRDVQHYLPRVVRGGHIWFDDVNWQTTQAAALLLDAACDRITDITTAGQHCRLYRKR